MSLSKAIKSGKEHRVEYGTKNQPYCKSVDKSCRNHGNCPYCTGNRLYKDHKEDLRSKEALKEWKKRTEVNVNEVLK